MYIYIQYIYLDEHSQMKSYFFLDVKRRVLQRLNFPEVRPKVGQGIQSQLLYTADSNKKSRLNSEIEVFALWFQFFI